MQRYSTYLTCLWLTIGALLLSACARDLWEPDNVPGGSAAGTGQDSCYVNLCIVGNTPTRATEAEENAIYDGILAIFEGTDAATATLKRAVVIDQLINNPHEITPTTTGTTAINITQSLSPLTSHLSPLTSHLFVLALLNTTPTGFMAENGILYHNDNDQSNKTLAQIQALTLNSVGSPDEHVGLFMTNVGGLVEATTLYDTEQEARTNFSTDHITINVERAAARLRVSNGIGNSTLSAIKLNDNSNSHPAVHHISWALASEATGSFALYQQQSHQSGDAVYIPESATPTGIIVEVQLKDGSFLIDDCYKFNYSEYLYSSASQFVKFLKDGWSGQKWGYDLGSRSADDIYGNMKMEMADNGSITFTFTMDTSSYSDDEKNGLGRLKTFLQDNTRGYRNGKMYYTYYINNIEHNNAYNLTLAPSSITGIGRTTP